MGADKMNDLLANAKELQAAIKQAVLELTAEQQAAKEQYEEILTTAKGSIQTAKDVLKQQIELAIQACSSDQAAAKKLMAEAKEAYTETMVELGVSKAKIPFPEQPAVQKADKVAGDILGAIGDAGRYVKDKLLRKNGDEQQG